MKISTNQVATILRMYHRTTLEKAKEVKPAMGGVRQDRVSLSNSAMEINKYARRYREVPAIREQLVEDLKHRTQSGTYHIQGSTIVEKMFSREMVDFLIERGEEQG
ncbi:MAG TPA: flagellar biosynthesis anti-sigma factor FlgM [Atribacteraceae bacterium]|nr:flagellar biosynthesis anti-sigma factor FlgM [Atribacteraceae bacterium]